MTNLIIQIYIHLKILQMNKISNIMNLINKYVLKKYIGLYSA